MASVWIPSLLRDSTGGQEVVAVPGSSIAEIVEGLESRFPGIKSRLCTGDTLRTGLAVVVDSQVSSLGLRQTVRPQSEVHFLPAIGGG